MLRCHLAGKKRLFVGIGDICKESRRRASLEADFLKLLQVIQRKLGKYKSATQAGWRGNSTPAGTVVVLTYNSEFEKHSAVETFTFNVSGDTATLQGYNINSNALITE